MFYSRFITCNSKNELLYCYYGTNFLETMIIQNCKNKILPQATFTTHVPRVVYVLNALTSAES